MPIQTAELQWFNPQLVSDATPAQNGGRPSQTQNVSGIKNNLFPDVSAAQRAAGCEHWRKAFIQVKNADNLPLVDPRISIESGTPGDSHVLLYPGTWTDTQATRSGRPYGFATLALAADATDTEFVVTTEVDYSALADQPFQAGDLLRIDARADVLTAGLSEYVTLASVVQDGAELTLTLTAGLLNGYAQGVKVASVIAPGDLSASVSGLATTGGVTYDAVLHPLAVPQLGGIEQTWTITVTNGTTGALSVVGDTLGSLGTGATGVDLAPANPLGGTYFTLAAAVIFAHNHPSGVAEPSQADLRITQQLKTMLELIEVRILDHIIIGDGDGVSFAERGLL
jgi:hypothetical protein